MSSPDRLLRLLHWAYPAEAVPATQRQVLIVREHQQDVWAVLARRTRGGRVRGGWGRGRRRRQPASARAATNAQLPGVSRAVVEDAGEAPEAANVGPRSAGRLGGAHRAALAEAALRAAVLREHVVALVKDAAGLRQPAGLAAIADRVERRRGAGLNEGIVSFRCTSTDHLGSTFYGKNSSFMASVNEAQNCPPC